MQKQIKNKKVKPFKTKTRPVGEPYVWFTAMGLALGIVMIVFLLGVILIKGVNVFWPKPVAVITLSEDSAFKLNGSNIIAGTIQKKQAIKGRVLLPDAEADETMAQEWQLFVGNKDLYGFSFKFIDVEDIKNIEYPEDIMRIERLEYGDALGYPLRLEIEGQASISVYEAGFHSELKNLIHEGMQRWKDIQHLEKKKIGAINFKLEKLRLKKKSLSMKSSGQWRSEVEKLTKKMTVLQEDYELLADQARKMRGLQTQNHLVYRDASGQEKRLPVGNIVHSYFPNDLTFFERIGHFISSFWGFLVDEPREANTEGGVFPAIFGTCVMTILMSIVVMPFGVIAAIYLREYAKQGFLVRSVRIAVNNLAGVPSIVFGVFGLGFFVYFVGGTLDHLFFKEALPTPTFGTGGIFWASLTLALLTVPVVIVSTEEAIAAVPRGVREGSLACGASKWQTIKNIVLPASAPGILTGLILAMARGASEVAPLMLVGVVKLAPTLPIDELFPFMHLERKFMHLGFHIYDLGFQSPDSEAAKPMVFATTLLLIALVVVLNLGAIFIRERLRKKYATGAF